MLITLDRIEDEYRQRILDALGEEDILDAESLVELAIELFRQIKVEGISESENSDYDMLLFQYGVWNWGDEFGKHFSLDITRQFIKPEDDEPYQLHFQLIYDPEDFEGMRSYNCWSMEFSGAEEFARHIKSTEGFEKAGKVKTKAYELLFEQC